MCRSLHTSPYSHTSAYPHFVLELEELSDSDIGKRKNRKQETSVGERPKKVRGNTLFFMMKAYYHGLGVSRLLLNNELEGVGHRTA